MLQSHPANDVTLNPSDNESIRTVIDRVDANRRRLLKSGMGATALALFGGYLPLDATLRGALAAPPPVGGLGFSGIPANVAPMLDKVSVPAGYEARVLISWGDPILPGAPAWNPDATQTAADQEKQYGMHNDGMHFFPFPTSGASGQSSERGLLCVNNEYTHEEILHGAEGLTGGSGVTLAKVRKSQAAHGVSVFEIRKVAGKWTVIKNSPFNRRLTANTPMTLSGPAAGNAMLKTAGDPSGAKVLGTINNCAHGFTPWGTYLTCEENWNGNFGTADATFNATRSEHEGRYGLSAAGFDYRWHLVDDRFDVRVNPNEPNRFGWVVEIDPFAPASTPIKRTALGRFKHESVFTVIGPNNEVVAYSGDDEVNEYVYKFVAAGRFDPNNRGANRGLLDNGTLHVAKFNADGTGAWLPLVWNQNGLTPANGFANQGEVLVKTRQAADRVGATMMDRPEWIAVHPTTKEVYLTLTNNSRRGTAPASSNLANGTTDAAAARPPVDAANPRTPNVYGHIMRWRETGGNPAALTFEWDIFVQCGDSLDVSPPVIQTGNINGDDYGAPDGLWFDYGGRLWIQTDQRGDAAGDWVNIGGNSMLCADPSTGETRRFLTSPPFCEVTGVITTPDGKTMFVNIQHPGEQAPAANPMQNSQWPDNGLNGPTTNAVPARPRSSCVVVTRTDGGVIGAI